MKLAKPRECALLILQTIATNEARIKSLEDEIKVSSFHSLGLSLVVELTFIFLLHLPIKHTLHSPPSFSTPLPGHARRL